MIQLQVQQPISIHALREEGDRVRQQPTLRADTFLSTPSARRATGVTPSRSNFISHFYPRPPRGGRPATSTPMAL